MPKNTPEPPKDHAKLMDSLSTMVKAPHNGIVAQKDGSLKHRGGAVAKVIGAMQDGWSNLLTGVSTWRDKRMHNVAHWGLSLTEEEAEELMAGDNIARRIVEMLPREALREAVTWEDEEASKPLIDELKRLQWWERSQEDWIFARLYGGGGILMNDGVTAVQDLHKPLADDAKIDSLVALTRWELIAWATDMQRDVTKPNYGQPQTFHLYPRNSFGQVAFEVHASRIIRFDGKRLPRLLHIRNNFWGDSVLTSIKEILGDYKVTVSNVANVMHDFRLAVQKIKGLTGMMATTGGVDRIKRRFAIQNESRSVLGSLVIDAEDDFLFTEGGLTGVTETAKVIQDHLAAEVENIPHNMLFNEGAGHSKGLGGGGGGGDAEQEAWYDYVHGEQETYLRPRTDELVKRICMYLPGLKKPEDHVYEFPPLWQMDDKDRASMEYSQAQADEINVNLGVRSPAQIQRARFPQEAEETPAKEDLVDPQAQQQQELELKKTMAAAKPAPGAKPAPKQ